MKARTLFVMTVMLMALAGMNACENEDNPVDDPKGIEVNESLYGVWLLQGYGSDSNFTDAVHGHLILHEDGTLTGGIVNGLNGTYTFNSNGDFAITKCIYTKMYHVNEDYNFMEDQIIGQKIKRFSLSNNELRLFYSSDEYLLFIKR